MVQTRITISPPHICVIIASHISSAKRIQYLLDCLISIINQETTTAFSIFLSISFEQNELNHMFSTIILKNPKINTFSNLNYSILTHKTPQMRHIQNACSLISAKKLQSPWVMFCDDDDTYVPTRIDKFAKKIQQCLNESPQTPENFAGVYESTFGKTHHEHRHEYWCYCIKYSILHTFLSLIDPYPEIIDHKCCDIVFADYLRRIKSNMFSLIEETMYNYRRENNDDSITGTIVGQQKTAVWRASPPPIDGTTAIIDYILKWNEYLYENIDIYIHDTYLKTVVGIDIDRILASEFRQDYALIDYIDQGHVDKIREYHTRIRTICLKIYETPF